MAENGNPLTRELAQEIRMLDYQIARAITNGENVSKIVIFGEFINTEKATKDTGRFLYERQPWGSEFLGLSQGKEARELADWEIEFRELVEFLCKKGHHLNDAWCAIFYLDQEGILNLEAREGRTVLRTWFRVLHDYLLDPNQ